MGVSFKVSKTGRRFVPRPVKQSDDNSIAAAADVGDGEDNVVLGSSKGRNRIFSTLTRKSSTFDIGDKYVDASEISETEVSFTLSLFLDGYSIGKPSEGECVSQTHTEIPKVLHPYDRASEALFSAIEAGKLPGDILDDIPCKYVNGALLCEVRDYRKCISEAGGNLPSTAGSPIVHKIRLRMSLENVVKDIPSISDRGWTYGDLMEVESRILKALQPKLCLDPTPKLERLGENPTAFKLNLGVCNMRKRLRQIPDVTVTNNIHGKKVCIDRVPENSRFTNSGSVIQQPVHENLPTPQNNGPNSMVALRSNSIGVNSSVPSSPMSSNPSKNQMGVGSPRIMQDPRSGSTFNSSVTSHTGQDMVITYSDNSGTGASTLHGRRDNQDMQQNLNKRSRHTTVGVYGTQQQHAGSPMDNFQGQDANWKNTILQRGITYANNTGMQKYSLPMFEAGLDQEQPGSVPFAQGGIKYGLKEEPVETERLDRPALGQIRNEMHGALESELHQTDAQQSRLSQRMPQQLIRSNFPQTPWNNLGHPIENNSRKDDPYQKRKVVQSPRVSTGGGIPHSPLSSKSGELSSGSVGPQVGAAAVTSNYLPSQKEKSVNLSAPHMIGAEAPMTSSGNTSMQRQHQAQLVAKRRSNSLPKTPAMSGVGSPASVSNTSMPINVSSPPVGTPPLADPVMFDRFSKINVVSTRFGLNRKKSKVDQYLAKKVFSVQKLSACFSSDLNNTENFKDDSCKMPLSTSLVGGSMNICKTRVLNFLLPDGNLQGNGFPIVPKPRTRLIMSEKPNDGTVAFHIGEIEDAQYLAAEDYLPTLPNTHTADLLAAQFSSLMTREGYLLEDHVQPKPVPSIHSTSNQPNTPGSHPYNAAADMQQYPEGVSGPQSSDINKSSNSTNSSLNPANNLQGTRMLATSRNAQGLQISQGLLSAVSMPPRPQQQPDSVAASLQQQNQQQLMQSQPQFQRSSLAALASNPMLNTMGQNSNVHLANYMNKPSHLQLQMLQQQQQLMQRKMMSSLGNAASVSNMANNIVGFGNLGNMMGMGVRGVGGTGISSPMASIAGMGNMAQNPLNLNPASNINNMISQQLRPGMSTSQNMYMSKMRMGQNRGNMPGAVSQSGSISGGMAGARQINSNAAAGLQMLGTAMNRGTINQIQRPIMGPPKLMSGNSPYLTQQQLQQMHLMQQQLPQQQQQQLQQMQQQQQQQMQQQQESSSPLHAVTSPQVGSPSPSNMGMPQQVNQPTNQQQQQQQQQLQQASPQQMSQRTPMSPQLSSGAVHTISTGGNQEALPASPQLSSQTLGSVGSITNSPMELQGVNKSS